MILKAGTYRFNDVLDFSTWGSIDEISLPFISQDENFIIIGFYDNQLFYNTASHDDTYAVYQNYESDYMSKGWVDVAWQNTTIPKDSEVNDTFGTWYISNTNYNEVNATPLATIEYNGQIIAQLNAGETATLPCAGKKMASDVVVKVNKVESKIPEGYVKPEGTLEITLNNIDVNPIDCSQYAKVTVNTAEPLRISDPTVLDNIIDSPWGVGGSVFLYEGATTDSYENGTLYYLEDTEK